MNKLAIQTASDTSFDNLSPFMSDDAEIQGIISRANKITLMPKERLVWGADSAERTLYILRTGIMKMRVHLGAVEALELLYPGAFFGGLSHPSNDGTRFEAIAIEPSTVAAIDQQSFLELQRVGSKFFQYYMTAMSLYMAALRGDYNLLNELSLKARLARALYKDFKRRGKVVDGFLTVSKILSQEEWAKVLRARRETVSRAFAEYEREGTLSDSGSSYVLTNEFNLLRLIAEAAKKVENTSKVS